MEQEDYSRSSSRARLARSFSRASGLVVRDFKPLTRDFETNRVRWHWFPVIEESILPIWNPEGGPALRGALKKTYWLCMGWSRMELLDKEGEARNE
jgi:hypothetical protein